MRSADMSDAVQAAECAEFLDLLASYDTGCKMLEEVEAGAAGAQAVEEIQSGLAAQRRQWLSALHRLGAKPAHTVLERFAAQLRSAYPACRKNPAAFWAVTASSAGPRALCKASGVRAARRRSSPLTLAQAGSIGLRSGL